MARTGCLNHCGGCGRHFTGLSAFDEHRKGGTCNDPESMMKKNSEPAFQSVTGFCNKMLGCFEDGKHIRDVEPVQIWQGYMNEATRTKLREAWATDKNTSG